MTLAEKILRAKQDYDDVFEAGKAQGGGGSADDNPLYYASSIACWNSAVFPDGYELKIKVKNVPNSLTSAFMYASGVKKVILVCETSGTASWMQVFRGCLSVEVFDITNFNISPTSIQHFANNAKSLVSVLGEIDMSNCTNTGDAFKLATAFKDIRFKEGTISIALSFANCSLLTDESVQSIIDGLADLTGGTAQTLEFHSSVTAKLTDEQYLQISEKNWTTK